MNIENKGRRLLSLRASQMDLNIEKNGRRLLSLRASQMDLIILNRIVNPEVPMEREYI